MALIGGLDLHTVPLPKGTRIVLRCDVRGEDGSVLKAASPAVVRELAQHRYRIETPAGVSARVARDQITVPRADLLQDLGQRHVSFLALETEVILSSVVGSQAWGLADANSDEDIRGCFVLPFDQYTSLFQAPAEISDPHNERAYWEVERFLQQGLRGDPNTLEVLWSPLRKISTQLGEELVAMRDAFSSMNVLGSFGRYATSQLDKIERSQTRDRVTHRLLDRLRSGDTDEGSILSSLGLAPSEAATELKSVLRSMKDRALIESPHLSSLLTALETLPIERFEPTEHRPKNAYNLLRLLHSCESWLTRGVPLIEVQGELHGRLLSIKRGVTPLETTLAWARAQAERVESCVEASVLPDKPNYPAIDAFLQKCRARSARTMVQVREAPPQQLEGRTALPADVDPSRVDRFFEQERLRQPGWRPIWVALTGAHAYGFVSVGSQDPSVASDLDLKGVHLDPMERLLGLDGPSSPHNRTEVFEGREMDLTTLELRQAADLVLRGNGNLIEQLLGPYAIIRTEAGQQLCEFVKTHPCKRSFHHYMGFCRGILRQYAAEKAGGARRVKRILYAYRVGLSGRHWLETGSLVMDLGQLWRMYRYPEVESLIEWKRIGEKVALPDGQDDTIYLSSLERVLDDLKQAYEMSPLAESIDPRALHEVLVSIRWS